MDKLKLCISLLILPFICNCNGSHTEDDVEFFIRNGLDTNITWNSFNIDSSGFAGEIIIPAGGDRFTGGGGILDVDSVLFVRRRTGDTIIYRNARHGDMVVNARHFFNFNNWVEEEYNKFYYTVLEIDFEQ